MTAKEKVLERAPHWTEEQAKRALRAAEGEDAVDEWGDLSKLPTEVELGREHGMPRRCVLNADRTDTIAKGCLGDLIAVLGPDKLDEVCRALDHATGC